MDSLHANTDIAMIMGQKPDLNRLRGRPASGARRQIPKPSLDYARGGPGFAATVGKRNVSAVDTDGAKIRKELA